jgi:hypothetical protein
VGTETIRPVWAALNLKLSEMNGPMAPFKTQTANEKSKYRNAASNVGGWPDFRNSFALAMMSIPFRSSNKGMANHRKQQSSLCNEGPISQCIVVYLT